jgi:hypothetical protein
MTIHPEILDIINSIYEMLGGFFILLHCKLLFEHKKVFGVSVPAVIFFTSWGVFNLFYYNGLSQNYSLIGSLFTCSANIVYVVMLLHYKRIQT